MSEIARQRRHDARHFRYCTHDGSSFNSRIANKMRRCTARKWPVRPLPVPELYSMHTSKAYRPSRCSNSMAVLPSIGWRLLRRGEPLGCQGRRLAPQALPGSATGAANGRQGAWRVGASAVAALNWSSSRLLLHAAAVGLLSNERTPQRNNCNAKKSPHAKLQRGVALACAACSRDVTRCTHEGHGRTGSARQRRGTDFRQL